MAYGAAILSTMKDSAHGRCSSLLCRAAGVTLAPEFLSNEPPSPQDRAESADFLRRLAALGGYQATLLKKVADLLETYEEDGAKKDS